MSQRSSGYERLPDDIYVTPRWVYEALYTVEPWARDAWDCAPVDSDFDFLSSYWKFDDGGGPYGIATNPPFSLAPEFCRHALKCAPKVAMLLSIHFDSAKGRRDLFADNPAFKIKYTLTKRIRWENLVQNRSGPSQNHAWFVWDNANMEPPRLGWL